MAVPFLAWPGLLAWLLALFLLSGCRQPARATAPAGPPAPASRPTASLPAATPRTLPTLYPTFTPPAVAPPTPTPTPRPGQALPTSIPFDTVAISLRYAIPSLSLARRLEGNVGSQIMLADETTGLEVTRNNQGPVLFELQQALLDLTLPALPPNCDTCVHLTFSLPLIDREQDGWLQDPVLLASVENFMAINLGPHFPPGSVAGLRRSASPYDVAQTVALSAEGRLWRWRATAAQVGQEEAADPALLALLAALPLDALADGYSAACPGAAVETLFLAGSDPQKSVSLACPQLALPTTLVPFYAALDSLLAAMPAPERLPSPPLPLSLNDVLRYQRADGADLRLSLAGELLLRLGTGETISRTLPVTDVFSLTAGLAEGGVLAPGAQALLAAPATAGPGTPPAPFAAANVLAVRTALGLFSYGWDEMPAASLLPLLVPLDAWVESLAPPASPVLTPTVPPPATP